MQPLLLSPVHATVAAVQVAPNVVVAVADVVAMGLLLLLLLVSPGEGVAASRRKRLMYHALIEVFPPYLFTLIQCCIMPEKRKAKKKKSDAFYFCRI